MFDDIFCIRDELQLFHLDRRYSCWVPNHSIEKEKKDVSTQHKLYVSFRPKINKRFYVFSSSINAYNLWWYSSQENNMPKNYSFKHKHDSFFLYCSKVRCFFLLRSTIIRLFFAAFDLKVNKLKSKWDL